MRKDKKDLVIEVKYFIILIDATDVLRKRSVTVTVGSCSFFYVSFVNKLCSLFDYVIFNAVP